MPQKMQTEFAAAGPDVCERGGEGMEEAAENRNRTIDVVTTWTLCGSKNAEAEVTGSRTGDEVAA